jgi:predicted transposase YdaD
VINHDALFKSLLRTGRLLRDFFEAFLPKIYAFIDFDHIEFLDKERFTHERKRRTGDLLVKTRFRGEDASFLIHLEHEAQAHRDLPRRMLEYFVLDWRDFDLPVYPIAVLSHKELDSESSNPLRMTIRGDSILDFHFAVIDLARLDARQYVSKLNAAAMALSSRMRVDPAARVSFAVDFISNTVRAKWTPKELDAVSTFFFAYQEFTEEEDLKLQGKLGNIKNMQIPKEVLRRNPLVRFGITEGRQEGRKEGRHQGEIELVLRLLARRLNAVPPRQQQAIRKLPLARIEALGEALLDFHTKTDLSRWLKSHSK